MSPFAHHASSQSAQFSSLLVTRVKSPGSTPCDVNRGPQLAMADLTCSSGTGILSLAAEDRMQSFAAPPAPAPWPRSSPVPARGRAGLQDGRTHAEVDMAGVCTGLPDYGHVIACRF